MKDPRGNKTKDDCGLGPEMDTFWKNKFSAAYPELIDLKGNSYLKQLIAQQILQSSTAVSMIPSGPHALSHVVSTASLAVGTKSKVGDSEWRQATKYYQTNSLELQGEN